MFCDHIKNNAVQASFVLNAENAAEIHFFDPSYARADNILYNSDTRAVHAVLHERLHFIGHVPAEIGLCFAEQDQVLLSANHYSGSSLRLQVPITQQTGQT